MYSKYKKNAIVLFFLSLMGGMFALFFFSCSDTEAIFASIEKEEKIESGNLSDETTGQGMARIGNNYILSTGGALFYRNVNGNDWNILKLPESYEGAMNLVEVYNTERAYVVLVKEYYTEPSEFAMYKLSVGGNVVSFDKIHSSSDFLNIYAVSNRDGGSGTTGTDANDNVFAVQGVFSADAINDLTYYQNYNTTSPNILQMKASDWPSGKELTKQSANVIDIAYDSDTTTYYLANESNVFKITAGNILEVVKHGDSKPWGFIGGMYYSTLYDTLFVSSGRYTDGGSYIYASTDEGSTWSNSGKKTNRFFTRFIDIDQTSYTGLLVGTSFNVRAFGRDEGYFELENGNVGTTDTPSGNKYTSGKLDTAGVMGFYKDSNVFFVMTKGLGVWRGNYNNGRSIDWYLE